MTNVQESSWLPKLSDQLISMTTRRQTVMQPARGGRSSVEGIRPYLSPRAVEPGRQTGKH